MLNVSFVFYDYQQDRCIFSVAGERRKGRYKDIRHATAQVYRKEWPLKII